MVIQSVQNKSGPYTGDNAQRAWGITFPVNSVIDSEIVGYLDDGNGVSVEITADFEVDRNALTYTYPTVASGLIPLTSNQLITIVRTLALTQDTDLRNQGSVPAEVIEQSFDRLTMMAQQLKEQIDRSPQTDISGSGADTQVEAILLSVEAARDDAQAAATAAATDATAVAASVIDVQTAVTDAQTAQSNAESAETGAETAQAAAEAAAGTVTGSISPYAAGDVLLASNDTERQFTGSTAYRPSKSINVVRPGTLRVKFDLDWVSGVSINAYGRIARDRDGVITFVGTEQLHADGSSAYETKTEDISGWLAGDLCVLYVANIAGATGVGRTRNFRIYADLATIETTFLDAALT